MIFSVMKNGVMTFAGKWVELEIFLLSELSEFQKDKYLCFLFFAGPSFYVVTEIHRWSQFGFCCCDKTLIKANLGRKEFISAYRLQSIIKGRRNGVKAGTLRL